MTIHATLCQVIRDGRILLLLKDPGRFGEGKWNGPGGKVDEGETPLEGVVREVREETGLTILDPELKGEIDFYFGEKDDPDWHVHVFKATRFTGKLKQGDEGELRWFRVSDIPYSKMWQDDEQWLPILLDGKRFQGVFWFNTDGSELIRYELDEK
jgi:8-oxo-dGTP pyrophosphatase MutT (NUDIX family)